MGCQRDPGPPRRVRLTDQALVAVTLARQAAAARDREPTSLDLLLGLAAEPDGWAGHLLRRRDSAAAALVVRAAAPPPGLTPLLEVVATAAERAAPRPPGTRDLLRAVLTDGGEDVDDLLASCGFAEPDLWADEPDDGKHLVVIPADGSSEGTDPDVGGPPHPDVEVPWAPGSETVTLDGPDQPLLSPAAARAVAKVRALAGGALDLVELLLVDLDEAQRKTLPAGRSSGVPTDEPWDAGLDAVLDAVAVVAGGRAASTYHLLQAALLAGGRGPRDRLGLLDDTTGDDR
jgi:hypothetical protein